MYFSRTWQDSFYFFGQSRDNPPLLPLTVKQISQAIQSSDEKSNFVIDGVDVNNVSVVLFFFSFWSQEFVHFFGYSVRSKRAQGLKHLNFGLNWGIHVATYFLEKMGIHITGNEMKSIFKSQLFVITRIQEKATLTVHINSVIWNGRR